MKAFSFLIFCFLISLQTIGQDYILYHQIFNRIDEDILQNDFTLALTRLDSIYTNYDFIYATHCIKALQICSHVEDSIQADKWLEKSFKQGVPFWIIRTNELTRKSLLYSTTKNTVQNHDSLYAIYQMSINQSIANKIDSLFIIDQKCTRKVNDGFILFRNTIYGLKWVINNKKQFKIINNIIDEYGFPGEKLIGVSYNWEDSIKNVEHIAFWGPANLGEGKAYTMLVHYFSTRHKENELEEKLRQNLINGYIPPRQFSNICNLMFRNKKNADKRYYVVSPDVSSDTIDILNNRRHSIGLNSIEQEKRNEEIVKENRKNRKANSVIFMEL